MLPMCPVRCVTHVSGRSTHLRKEAKTPFPRCSGKCSGRLSPLPGTGKSLNRSETAAFAQATLWHKVERAESA